MWSALDIDHGDWQQVVREKIRDCGAVIAILSGHARNERTMIFRDEIDLALKCTKPVLPFVIGEAEIPLGIGPLNRTEAIGWKGSEDDSGFQQLKKKVGAALGALRGDAGELARPISMSIHGKNLKLPAFIFSLSSHETQVSPLDGTTLLLQLQPEAALVSAYDAWKHRPVRDRRLLRTKIKRLKESNTILFLDSGNYEAYRKNDRYAPTRNPKGWRKEHFYEMARLLSPDIAFSFDSLSPVGSVEKTTSRIVKAFRADQRALGDQEFSLCPIIHLPPDQIGSPAEVAAATVASVAKELDPVMLAIPERELGDGLVARARAVREIRKSLNALGKYYPLHLLGTGNPMSMEVLAIAGGDAFDGLEWCRTVADYGNGHLCHFHQFDFFLDTCLPRVQDPKIRLLIESPDVPYPMKVLSYNVDFFTDWSRTMQKMIHSGQSETLLKNLPGSGPHIFRDFA